MNRQVNYTNPLGILLMIYIVYVFLLMSKLQLRRQFVSSEIYPDSFILYYHVPTVETANEGTKDM
jgi:hypothetical protein